MDLLCKDAWGSGLLPPLEVEGAFGGLEKLQGFRGLTGSWVGFGFEGGTAGLRAQEAVQGL